MRHEISSGDDVPLRSGAELPNPNPEDDMTLDLTSGLGPEREYFLTQKPDDPQLRESASMWIFDQDGMVGLPRVGIEAIGQAWDAHGIQVNLAFPDGRAVVARGQYPNLTQADDDGLGRALRAGGLQFRVVEPFVKWKLTYDGEALDTTSLALSQGDTSDAVPVRLQVHVETTMAAPPWIPGALVEKAGEMMSGGIFADFISERYEQLCRAEGAVTVGDESWSFTGTGLRIRRQGVRNVGGFWGHCWQSALFPNGTGFGYLAFPDREGEASFNEGYYFDGEKLIAAEVVEAPWLKRLTMSGEDVGFTLRTKGGDIHVEGRPARAIGSTAKRRTE
jgi:hypothetical protein